MKFRRNNASAKAVGTIQRRYHPHLPGFLYVGVTLLIAVGAINSQNNLLFAALGLGIGGLLISGVISGAALMGIRIERESLDEAQVGREVRISYRVRNLAKIITAFALHIHEELESGGSAETQKLHAFVPRVRPGGATAASAALTPHRRGILRFESVRIWTTFPFGLTRKSIRIIQPDAIVILPAVHALHPDAFKRVLDHATTGSGTRPLPGASVEYYGVREYVPGDSPRRIAWRASARTGAIVVRQDSAPAPARVWIILRRSSSFDADAIESAVSLAASLVASSVQQGFAVGLVTDDGALTHPPRTGRLHIRRLMRDLAVWNPATSSPASLLPESATRSGACVVVHIGAMEHAHTPPHAVHFTGADLPRLRISEGAPREAVPA